MGTIVRCIGCDIVTLVDSRSGALPACNYNEQYFNRDKHEGTVGYRDYFGTEQVVRRQVARVLADIIRATEPELQSMVDIGCGGGYLVHAMSRLGVTAVGVDPSRYAIERARKNGPGQFLVGHAQASARFAPFDVASMMDVIEHVADPVSFVRSAAAIVRPGGYLIALTPRFGGRLLSDQGERYVHFNRDHIYYFTEATLRRVFRLALPQARIRVFDVADAPSKFCVMPNSAFRAKYTAERDSMLAVLRIGVDRAA